MSWKSFHVSEQRLKFTRSVTWSQHREEIRDPLVRSSILLQSALESLPGLLPPRLRISFETLPPRLTFDVDQYLL